MASPESRWAPGLLLAVAWIPLAGNSGLSGHRRVRGRAGFCAGWLVRCRMFFLVGGIRCLDPARRISYH
jgi:hypothetical protein